MLGPGLLTSDGVGVGWQGGWAGLAEMVVQEEVQVRAGNESALLKAVQRGKWGEGGSERKGPKARKD